MGYFSMSDKIDGGGFVPRIYMAHEFFTKAIRLEPETNLGTLLSILDSFLDMYEEYMRDGVQTKKLLNGLWNDRFLRRTGKTLGTSTSGGYWGELKNGHPDGWGIECSYNHMESGKIHSVTIGRRKVAYIREKFGWTAVITGPSVRSEISKDGTTLTVSVVE